MIIVTYSNLMVFAPFGRAYYSPSILFTQKMAVRLAFGRQWAPSAHGQAMKGGHFFPEENPDDTAVLVKQFLSA
jgi:hypothetical protein